MDLARLWLGLLLPLAAALDFSYHHQQEMEAFLKSVAQNYSSITHLHSIGKSVEGRSSVACASHSPLPLIKSALACFLSELGGGLQLCWLLSASLCCVCP